MVKLAPPAFVVAMVSVLLWIPWALLQYAVELPLTSMEAMLVPAMFTVGGALAMVGAMAELATRTRGWIRAGLVVSTIGLAFAFVLAAGGGFILMKLAATMPYDLGLTIFRWVNSGCWLVAWLAFGIAGWRAQRRTAITIVGLAVVLDNVPPVRELLIATFGQWVLFFLYVIVTPVRDVIAILLAGAIAQRGYEPSRDHLAAARNMKMIAFAVAALAAVQLATAAATRMLSEEIDVRFGFALAQLAGVGILAVAIWRLAQKQLPALPRFRVHVAALGAVYSAVMIAETFTYTSRGSSWAFSTGAMQVVWWYLAPVTLALALVVTILLTYARHRDAVYAPALGGGAVFIAGVASWFILRDHELVSPVSLAGAYLALVPALLRASRELSTDRVQTTADVFA